MRVVHSATELPPPAAGRSRAVVMTMGALHDGHLALVRAARAAADEVVVTVFVNPLQFNDRADLERYPRTLDADVALLEPEGVDFVFAPAADDVYPGGRPVVTVSAGAINDVFEGAHRPGHFDGVLTVVLKLINLTRPDVAFFGQKDAQQVIAIRTMCRDLNVPIEIAVVPTVREPDGLALSSRNVFLTPNERADALALSRALAAADVAAGSGASAPVAVAAGLAEIAAAPGVALDYLAALDPESAQPVADDYRGPVVIAVAAKVGATRLIDNVVTQIAGDGTGGGA